MQALGRHLSRCFLAGVVALLPVGGLILSVVYMESAIAGSWLAKQPFYFPGLGLLCVAAGVYLVGLLVATFLGRWLWSAVDRLLDRLPLVGRLYQTLKQILGYGEGKEAMFQSVVLVPRRDGDGYELGLVTNRLPGEGGAERAVVFLPGSPTPTTGRLLLVDEKVVVPTTMSVHDAFSALVSVGKGSLAGVG